MSNVLMPAVGSNQHITKFDEAKKKVRAGLKVKLATKIKIAVVLITLGSLYLNYSLLRTTYNVRCSVNGRPTGGLFPTKQECHDMATDREDSGKLARLNEALATPALSANCIGNEDICN